MAKILEKNFWARDFANVICQTRLFEDFIKNFPQQVVRDKHVGSFANKALDIFNNI